MHLLQTAGLSSRIPCTMSRHFFMTTREDRKCSRHLPDPDVMRLGSGCFDGEVLRDEALQTLDVLQVRGYRPFQVGT